MYKKILVGYDGSENSDAALDEAINLAKCSGGKIIIATSPELDARLKALAPEMDIELTGHAQATLDKASAKIKETGVEFETELLTATTAHEGIVETAKEKGADLIVLGCHGKAALVRLLMGSTTERVIGHTNCSVLVVSIG